MSGPTGVRSLAMLPVVTLGGDVVAHVRDTVFDTSARHIARFTLTGPSLWSGPLGRDLPWPAVHCLGRRAVMIRDEGALVALSSGARRDASRGRLLGAHVVTDEGEPVGAVLDVLVERGTSGRIVALRLAAHRHRRRRLYLPGGESLRLTGRTLVVPARTTAHLSEDAPTSVTRGGVPS